MKWQNPVKAAKKAIANWGNSHYMATCALAGASIIVMGALIVWFLGLSDMSAPAQFIYAGF